MQDIHTLHKQRGFALVSMSLAIVISTILTMAALSLAFVYWHKVEFATNLMQDKVALNNVIKAAARYGNFCPSITNTTIQHLFDTHYLAAMPVFKRINSGITRISITAPAKTQRSVNVSLHTQLTASTSSIEAAYYRMNLPAHFTHLSGGAWQLTLTRRLMYPSYRINDFGLGASFHEEITTHATGGNPC